MHVFYVGIILKEKMPQKAILRNIFANEWCPNPVAAGILIPVCQTAGAKSLNFVTYTSSSGKTAKIMQPLTNKDFILEIKPEKKRHF